jgi:hypothetical protein
MKNNTPHVRGGSINIIIVPQGNEISFDYCGEHFLSDTPCEKSEYRHNNQSAYVWNDMVNVGMKSG